MTTPYPIPVAPDYIGDVRGWRAWSVVGSLRVPRLISPSGGGRMSDEDLIWPRRQWFVANCPYGHTAADELPVESCSCGLYAALDREHLINYLGIGVYEDERAIYAIGEVAFAGKVIRGHEGWRAERGRVTSLILPYEHRSYACWVLRFSFFAGPITMVIPGSCLPRREIGR